MKKSDIQGELWGKAPNGWAKIQEPQHKPLWDAMLDVSGIGIDSVLLDVGCGAGGASAAAAQRGALVHGIDVAEGLLSFAELQAPTGKFQVADIEDLPYKDNTFDVIIAANSIQYSEDRIAALHELKRVCKPDGRIVAGLFGSPEKVEYRSFFEALRNAMPEPPKGGGPFELSMSNKLEELFGEAGLLVKEKGEINCPFQYDDFESFWFGNVSAGPIQGMLQQINEEHLKSIVREAVNKFMLPDERILIEPNIFKYVSAVV